MPTKTFKYTSYIVSIIEKLAGSNFSVTGLENLPKNSPTMFVANHFTRSETFFVPYLIHKYTGRQIRSLASSYLFSGFFGRFLKRIGGISTKDPDRNKIIISDLINNDHDWLIYPEGGMVKNKNITKDGFYISQIDNRTGPVRTGSAVLAIKSQLYRKDIIDAYKSSNAELLKFFNDNYDSRYSEKLENHTTFVVPITISYYPIRPGKNLLESFTRKRMGIAGNISEELEIEGNLLSGARINLHFNKAINLADYIGVKRGLVYQIPIIKNETKSNIITRYYKNSLTTDFMSTIYKNIRINFDHIFSASIRFLSHKEEAISIDHLKRVIFLSTHMIKKIERYRVGDILCDRNMVKLFNDERNPIFDGILDLAKDQGEITALDNNLIKINQDKLFNEADFHTARINNTLEVIFNEFKLLNHAMNIVKNISKTSDDHLKLKIQKILIHKDEEIYKKDYKKYYDKKLSKPVGYGVPFLGSPSFLTKKNDKFSILLCHGYKSCPKEMQSLSRFLNDRGFYTYCVRMAGHGTNPTNIKDITWQDWDDSFQRGYSALKNITDNVIVIGFSTGGLVSLLNASKKGKNLSAVIAINPAIRLRDIRSNLVSTIDKWNNLLGRFKIKTGSFEYVDSNPEDPKMNYSRNYLKGVVELKKLMDKCDKSLENVTAPTLLIQGSQDPVVNPQGADLIYYKIKSKDKFLFEPDFDNHVIINGKRKEEVFKIILNFLKKKNFL